MAGVLEEAHGQTRPFLDANRYEQRFTPRKANSNWSASNKERVKRMVESGQMTPAGQKTIDIAKKNGKWANRVRPRTEFPMPPELDKRLKRNRKAANFFDSLAPSYRREFIAWIAREATRNTQAATG